MTFIWMRYERLLELAVRVVHFNRTTTKDGVPTGVLQYVLRY